MVLFYSQQSQRLSRTSTGPSATSALSPVRERGAILRNAHGGSKGHPMARDLAILSAISLVAMLALYQAATHGVLG